MRVHKVIITMKLFFKIFLSLFITSNGFSQDWKPVSGHLESKWTSEVKASNPHPEYPRPQLRRSNNWQNINGLWNYKITPINFEGIPAQWDGEILVPYAIESSLSGVAKRINEDQLLWYSNEINIDNTLKREKLLLHFGAVDWKCEVFVNGKFVGNHEGGFDPFYFDITPALKKGNIQLVQVKVWDPTSEGPQPRGKQINNPHGIWYTPVTGIWQTVWLESVPKTHIARTKQTPNLDKSLLNVMVDVSGFKSGDQILITAYDNKKKIAETSIESTNSNVEFKLPKLQPWSPDSPKLYDLEVQVVRNKKVIDHIDTYFAMRKISFKKDSNGIRRMLLNNEFVFQYGPLDQGWWPDGLHTAPTDEALKFDIIKTKEMGFNMIRKHIKVEPLRWYHHCDSIGMLVWQDMPSGDLGGNIWDMHPGKIRNGIHDKNRSAQSEIIYRKEWKAIMDALHNFPSIVVWVPFNEGWGQFKTKEIVDWTTAYDPSRLINGASGGNFNAPGDIFDIHNYPDAAMPEPDIYGNDFILALGEFGGLGLPINGHTWQLKDNWGYQTFKNKEELKDRYFGLVSDLHELIKKGLSAAVYTQTTDVEIETNGLMTYDREVIKIPVEELNLVHKKLYEENLVKF